MYFCGKEKEKRMTNDEKYMRRCLQLAANGIQGARPNPMVGAVITLPLAPNGLLVKAIMCAVARDMPR